MILNKARKIVESPTWGVPFSISKLKEYLRLLYQISRVKQLQGKTGNLQAISKRREEVEIIDTTISVAQALNEKQSTSEEWKNIISKGRELQDMEILDRNSIIIKGETNKARKARKKMVNKMRKAEQRLWSIKFFN